MELPAVTQAGTAHYEPGTSTASATQTFSAVTQTVRGWFFIPVSFEPLIWEQPVDELVWQQVSTDFIYVPKVDELIWEVKTDELIYVVEEDEFIYDNKHLTGD